MNDAVVIDASIVVKLLVEEPNTQQAVDLAQTWRLNGVRVVAPYFMLVEVTNAIYKKALRQLISMEEAAHLTANLPDLGIQLRQPQQLHLRAIGLAAELQQNAVYDAHYLALAELLDCDFWTADERFHQAVVNDFPRTHFIGEIQPRHNAARGE